MEGRAVGHNIERGPPKDHPSQICFKLVQRFQRRRIKCTKPGKDSPWVIPFQNCVLQLHPPFKMVAATKNRNFFNCPLLLYYISKWAQIISDTILKGDHPRTIPAKFALNWFRGFRGEELNVIFYQNMSNLYNQYKSVERKISLSISALLQIKMNSNFNCS
jgi:hypothetical protein